MDLIWLMSVKPLHTEVSDNKLSVFGNLHIIYIKVNHCFGMFAFPLNARIAKVFNPSDFAAVNALISLENYRFLRE